MAYNYINSYNYMDPLSKNTYSEVFTGYSMAARNIGASTSVQTANQLAEVDNLLKQGLSTIEMGTMQPELFEQIPKQQFDDMRRMALLANAEVTVHAPLVDPSGFTQEGWSEQNRQLAEQSMLGIVRKSHAINPKGNVPITFHASTIGAEDWSTNLKLKPGEEGYHPQEMLVVIQPETGKINAFRKEEMYSLTGEKTIQSPTARIRSVNETEWQGHIIQVQNLIKSGDELMDRAPPEGALYAQEVAEGKITEEQLEREGKLGVLNSYRATQERAKLYYGDAETSLRTMYQWAAKYLPKHENKEIEAKLQERTTKSLKYIGDEWKRVFKDAESKNLRKLPLDSLKPLVNNTANILSHLDATPQIYMPVTEFALTQAPQTIATVALKAYREFGDTTPVMAVENVVPNMLFSRADTLIDLVKKSRQQFVIDAVATGKIKEEEARKQANKLIGATWDIAHINLLRKSGFTEKEIVEETKKIAPYVKKVHIADNFGMEHSDLPPGMGTAPIKEMLEAINKSGFNGKSIVECGSFVAAFKTSPVPYMFEALGAPIYTPQGGPMWGQARGLYGEGAISYGAQFPEQHFSMYGAGFSSLPSSLGGQMPGRQSRFSGAPME